jgi:hypothetical protein
LPHSFEGAWFQPLTYEVKTWFPNLPFEFNLYRYIVMRKRDAAAGAEKPVQASVKPAANGDTGVEDAAVEMVPHLFSGGSVAWWGAVQVASS